jgi:two-component system, OmpR family, sensor histidine kinase KdpD
MGSEIRRRTPEELLREVQAEEHALTKGRLKIFLGYASGVGKSFRMFDEARRRIERGEDVVVGAAQPRVAPEVQALLRKMEVIPQISTPSAGTPSNTNLTATNLTANNLRVDMGALMLRHPGVCVIDGLAYDNPPVSGNATRWQDVQDLLNAGINVITSINLQYVAELRPQVEAITGKHTTQTVPVAFLKSADEIEIVDAPLAQLMDSEPNHQLSRLRELALVLAADVVDQQLAEYLDCHGITDRYGVHERILVCITPRANVSEMMDMAQTIAGRFHADLIAAYVNQPNISAADQATLDEKLAIARAAGARIEILEGDDSVDTILDFAKSQGITQLFLGHSQQSGMRARILGSPVDRFIRELDGIDLRVFPQ